MRHFKFLALVAAAMMFAGGNTSNAAEFTDAQKGEIGTIVRDYLLKNPEVLQEVSAQLQQKQAAQQEKHAGDAIKQNASDIFRSTTDHSAGNVKGDVTVVEFFDYNCPYCKRSYPTINSLIQGDNKVRVVMKEFPILGAGSVFASRAAIAAIQQGKYWPLHEALMAVQGKVDEARVMTIAKQVGLDTDRLTKDMKSESVTAAINKNNELAQKLGINGTPAFIIGDQLSPGAIELADMQSRVAQVRANSCAVC